LTGPTTTSAGRRGPTRRETGRVARVSLLIPSHALPPLDYSIPDDRADEIEVGTAVTVPLSGYGRLGIVVGFARGEEGRALEPIRTVVGSLSLRPEVVKLCGWAAMASAQPLPTVLKAALPPGIKLPYEVLRPARNWPWRAGELVGKAELRRTLGPSASRDAEAEGRIAVSPVHPERRMVEWAVSSGDGPSEPPRRATRQRELLRALEEHASGLPVRELLRMTGAGRAPLKQLVQRGAVRIEERPDEAPISYTHGSGVDLDGYRTEAERALNGGGAWAWRAPTGEGPLAAAAVARAVARRGGQTLVLAPDVGRVEEMVGELVRLLPAGLTVSPYHGSLGRERATAYEAARGGEIDILVGTRTASLVPLASLGAVCVVDEPNEDHRASADHKGLHVHARELAMSRARIEGAAAIFLSPTPSLRLYAPESGARRLRPRPPGRWPSVGVVDMRGTGASLSSSLIEGCREMLRVGGRVGVVVNRRGLATSVSCGRCGHVLCCPPCDRPLSLRGGTDAAAKTSSSSGPPKGALLCGGCGSNEKVPDSCPACGSERLRAAGLAAEGVRDALAGALGVEVGLVSSDDRGGGGARVVVGTPRLVLCDEWEMIAFPDADAFLSGSHSAEKGFRVLYRAAEASRRKLLAQTRSPEHPALRAALRGDYESFAAAELPRRRALGYPPYGHHAEISLTGPEGEVRRAVESKLRPALGPGVTVTDPMPLAPGPDGGRTVWRLLLRGRVRADVASAASIVAKAAAGTGGKLRARIEMDPEEV
jgi:primosomal protein N' (replication factor Y)